MDGLQCWESPTLALHFDDHLPRYRVGDAKPSAEVFQRVPEAVQQG